MQRKTFVFLFSLFLMAGCIKGDKKANVHFLKAEKLRSNGNFTGAVSECGIIIYKYSKSSLVSKAEKLKADCEKEIEIAKTISTADMLIDAKYYDAGQLVLQNLIDNNPSTSLSEEINKKISSLTDNQAENSLSAAMELQKKGKYTQAIESYNKIIQAFPNSKEKDKIQRYISQCRAEISRIKTLGQKKQAEENRKRAEEEKKQKELEKKQSIENALKSLKDKTK